MVNDPIGDMLAQIRNASLAGRPFLVLPGSRLKFEVAKILAKNGYIKDVEQKMSENRSMLHINLNYQGKVPVISGIKRISKPGLRVYVNAKNIPAVIGGLGIAILSTPKGVVTGKEAKQQNVGGELLCKVW